MEYLGKKNAGFFKRFFPVFSTFFFALIVVTFVVRFFYARPKIVAAIIEDDIKLITLALEKVDAKCNILGVEGDYNDIDFLNVKAEGFDGSQIGSLNLAYPKKWEGPYLRVNPTIQQRFYELVRAKDGYFVIPGRGVKLPNGLVIGHDFHVGPDVLMESLLVDGGAMRYEDRHFAMKLKFKVGDWDSWHFKEETVRDIHRMMKEFNEAMPFTQNSCCDYKTA